jgi:hypothetical protein
MSTRIATPAALRPLDRLFADDRRSVSRANAILQSGWESRGLPPLRLTPPMPWEGVLAADRAWGVAIHAWDPLAPLIAAYDSTGRESYLEPALAVALDWLAMHPAGADVWQEVPGGRRAHRLAFLLDAAVQSGARSEADRSRLRRGLELHLSELAADERFGTAPGTAIEQAAGQLSVAARWPDLRGAREARSLAHARLAAYFGERIGADGGPLEHSPGVLWGELASLCRLFESGVLDDAGVRELRDRGLAGLAWFVTPAGRLAAFGDTDADVAPQVGHAEVVDPTARWIFSNGRRGEPPAEALRRFPDSGYAVVHQPRGRTARNGSYLAQIAGFHSTRHKHADELSFVWNDEGEELLVDPGRYGLVGRNPSGSEAAKRGFRYSDPRRTFVESTGAHNTVEIDGRSDARVRSRAYGSGLRRTASERGAHAIECEVRRAGVRHIRLLAFRPRTWLVVVDVLTSAPARHDFVQRFHFGPQIALELEAGRASTALGSGRRLDVMPLIGAGDVRLDRGREAPSMLGWVSPGPMRLEPVDTLSVVAGPAAERHTFVTAFVLSDSGAEPLAELVRANPTGRRIRVGWLADGRRHQVDLATDGDALALRHRAPVAGP